MDLYLLRKKSDATIRALASGYLSAEGMAQSLNLPTDQIDLEHPHLTSDLPKWSAAEVQEILKVEDHKIIAYGYTLDRATLEIFFEKGFLVRSSFKGPEAAYTEFVISRTFEPSFFFNSLKRWYLGTPERGLNPGLLVLFETFGNPLCTISGGKYSENSYLPL